MLQVIKTLVSKDYRLLKDGYRHRSRDWIECRERGYLFGALLEAYTRGIPIDYIPTSIGSSKERHVFELLLLLRAKLPDELCKQYIDGLSSNELSEAVPHFPRNLIEYATQRIIKTPKPSFFSHPNSVEDEEKYLVAQSLPQNVSPHRRAFSLHYNFVERLLEGDLASVQRHVINRSLPWSFLKLLVHRICPNRRMRPFL